MGNRRGKNAQHEQERGAPGVLTNASSAAAFPLCSSQVSGNQAKFLGPVGGAWARWNTPQVGRYPVLGDTHVIKAGDLSTPKVPVIIHWGPSLPTDGRNPNPERGAQGYRHCGNPSVLCTTSL